jgi:hypothetical protein
MWIAQFSPFDLQIIKGRIRAVKPVNSLTNRAKRKVSSVHRGDALPDVPGTPVGYMYGRNSTDILYR